MVKQEVWMEGIKAYARIKAADLSTESDKLSQGGITYPQEAAKFADGILEEYEKRFPHYTP